MFINRLHYWEGYKKSGYVPDGGETVFERLVEKGIIAKPGDPRYKSYYSKRMLKAKEALEAEYSNDNIWDRGERGQYRKILKEVRSGISYRIERKAKCIVLEEYFQDLIGREIDFKDVLREKWNIGTISSNTKKLL